MSDHYDIASPAGSIIKTLALSTTTSDADSGCAVDEYSWVPPGLTPQQASSAACKSDKDLFLWEKFTLEILLQVTSLSNFVCVNMLLVSACESEFKIISFAINAMTH
jgi:hypothetical protein